jgi:transcriptional regulator with XRE-family HTH domain
MQDLALRKRLGARLLTERIQEKGWNEAKAAAAAGLTPKTIRRIERAQNYEWDSLEAYAIALGKPLSEWLLEVLIPRRESQRSDTSGAAGSLQDTGTAGKP